ncbi:MAG: C39 family peptidase [Oscillospiraceae bacterium]
MGCQWESISTDDPQAVVDALASGKLIVALMSKGHFTSSGHFMVLRGVTSEGKILVADPASKKRSEQEWDISIILDEARKGAAAGGPSVGDLLKGCDMNNRNKLIELFIYIVIVSGGHRPLADRRGG